MGPTGSTGVMGLQGATGAMGLQGATGVMVCKLARDVRKHTERTVNVQCPYGARQQ
jgi:hypothetical protein